MNVTLNKNNQGKLLLLVFSVYIIGVNHYARNVKEARFVVMAGINIGAKNVGDLIFVNIIRKKNRCSICDPLGHLKAVVAARVHRALFHNKTERTLEYLGCDILTFRHHLESKLIDGMTWDNYGEWEIDHIIPIKYNNPTLDEVIARLHWTNTQPLWKRDNASKSNRFVSIVTN